MRTETIATPAPDESEHVIRWTDVDGDQERHVAGEAAARELWNGLHEGTADPARRVNGMTWHEVVALADEDGNALGVQERVRARFSHSFADLGVYGD